MIKIVRTNSANTDFQRLVKDLDKLLRTLEGEDHSFFAQFNKIDHLNHVIVAYDNEVPAGCGALKEYEGNTGEIKRMFVVEEKRGQGIASQVLSALEVWAKELGFQKVILETGHKQTEAIQLYSRRGYIIMPNYGQYKEVESSICFYKIII